MARELRRTRIDQPRGPRRGVRSPYDPEIFGKLSERISRFIGSWRFIFYMTAFVSTWMLWNLLAPADLRFDEWPFIGLTLMLSLQASYAAPLILLSQNRQTDREMPEAWQSKSRPTWKRSKQSFVKQRWNGPLRQRGCKRSVNAAGSVWR